MPPVVPQSSVESYAQRLCAAKAVCWRGRSDLPQFPWGEAPRGLFVVIDLWAGVSGTVIALLSLGLRVVVLAAEEAPDPVLCASTAMPNIVHIDKVSDVAVEMFVPLIRRRHPFRQLGPQAGS